MLWVRLELTRTRPIYYGILYRPPTGNLDNFIEHLTTITTTLRSQGQCEINCLGDINIDLMQNNAKTRTYLDAIKRLGLSNIIQETTHIKQQNLGFSILDHYITSDPQLYLTRGVMITNASDHFIIYATRKKSHEDHPTEKIKGRAYTGFFS